MCSRCVLRVCSLVWAPALVYFALDSSVTSRKLATSKYYSEVRSYLRNGVSLLIRLCCENRQTMWGASCLWGGGGASLWDNRASIIAEEVMVFVRGSMWMGHTVLGGLALGSVCASLPSCSFLGVCEKPQWAAVGSLWDSWGGMTRNMQRRSLPKAEKKPWIAILFFAWNRDHDSL